MERLREITENKLQMLPLLLLGDEQESRIDRYLERGRMFVLMQDEQTVGVCVVTDEGNGVCEVKNLSVDPKWRRRGYGRQILALLCAQYAETFCEMLVGTGDSPLTVPFYERCGFQMFYRLEGYFLKHCDHPIFEGGRQVTDLVYLKKRL